MAPGTPFHGPTRRPALVLALLMLGLCVSGFGSCFATIDCLAAFALAHFGDTPAERIDAHVFLHEKLTAENGGITLEVKPSSWDWLGTLLE